MSNTNSITLFKVAQFALIENNAKEILLLKPTGKDLWGIPGGKLDSGEDPEQGLRREVFEETGIQQLTIVSIFKVENFTSPTPPLNTYVTLFHCSTNQRDITLSDEHTEYAWASANNLSSFSMIHPKVLKAIKAYFSQKN